MDEGLGTLDLILLIGSILMSVLIGLYFTNKNKSLDSYMRADRGLSVVPVAISLMTSCMSGLTLLGASTELYYQGPTYAFIAVPMMLSGPLTAYTVLPVFYRMNELSLYKYLQKRYAAEFKYLVMLTSMVHMIFYNAVVMYLPAMALQSILGVSKYYSILFIGLICVVYSAIGGMKAVVWTDFFQAILMYASIIVVGLLGTIDAGGFANVFRIAKNGGRLNLDGFFDLDLTTRHTLFGVLAGSTIKHFYYMGVNQVQMQRALSLNSIRKAQWSFILSSLFTAFILLLSTYMGFVIYAAYRTCDPYLAHEIPKRDAITLHYVAHRLTQVPGIKGMFAAGIFSATLSTLSSFANSMAALMLEDFIMPMRRVLKQKELTDRAQTRVAKFIAALFGGICILVALVIEKSNSRLLQAVTSMSGAIGSPFLAAFILGIFTRFTNSLGTLAGFLVTVSLGLYVTLYQTFFEVALEPSMLVFYDRDQCGPVFNMTMSPETLLALPEESTVLSQVKPPFALHRISYMALPAVQFVLFMLISSVVSLLTGGWNQEVDEEYLATMKHRTSSRERKCLQTTGMSHLGGATKSTMNGVMATRNGSTEKAV